MRAVTHFGPAVKHRVSDDAKRIRDNTMRPILVTAPSHVRRALMVVGAIATGVVAVALVDKPNFFCLPYVPGLLIEIGAWLGLLGAPSDPRRGTQLGFRTWDHAWPGIPRIVIMRVPSKNASASSLLYRYGRWRLEEQRLMSARI